MRAIAASPGDRFVRDEPRIPPTPEIYGLTSFSGPSLDVALVLVWHAHCQSIKGDIALVREVEYVLVAIVYEPLAVYGLVMAYCNVAFDARVVSHIILGDGDGLDPMDHVLENEYLPQLRGYLERDPRIAGLGAYVQEERPCWRERARNFRCPFAGPFEILAALYVVIVCPVFDSQVVWGRRDHYVHGLRRYLVGYAVYAIAVVHGDGAAPAAHVDYLRCDAATQFCDTSLALECFSTRAEINPGKLNNRPKSEDLEGMDGNLERANWKHRTELIIGADGVARLSTSSVAVVGLGGVGSACAEALARAGVGKLILVDGDVVSATNINRQIIAFADNIGRPKAEVMAERVCRINPQCEVEPEVCWIGQSNVGELLRSGPDYVADAIDSIDAKLDLIEACLKSGTRIVSSMGAGNRLDPTMFKVADISKTRMCPMARSVRQGLRKRGIGSGLTVVFSEEPPAVRGNGPIGSISTTPPAAGLAMASVIIRQLALDDLTREG